MKKGMIFLAIFIVLIVAPLTAAAVWTTALSDQLQLYYNFNTTENLVNGSIFNLSVGGGTPSLTSNQQQFGFAANFSDLTSQSFYNISPETDLFNFSISGRTINFLAIPEGNLGGTNFMTGMVASADACDCGFQISTNFDGTTVNVDRITSPGIILEALNKTQPGWIMVTMITQADRLLMYINGTLEANETRLVAEPNITNIGYANGGESSFFGLIDEYGVWDRAISPEEVLQLYNNGSFLTFDPNGLDTSPPQITINFPTNTTFSAADLPLVFNVSTNENATVFYTLNDGVNNFSMSGNESEGFGTMFNATNLSIEDGSFTFRVFANDTLDNKNNSIGTVTFSIDQTFPNITIHPLEITQQSITFNATVNDTNLELCFYAVYNSSGDVDGLHNNVSYTCNVNTPITVTLDDHTLYIYANDTVDNFNSRNVAFTVNVSNPPSEGGGGGGEITVTQEGNWSVQTEQGTGSYKFSIPPGGDRTRDLVFNNIGVTDVSVVLTCEQIDNTSINLCQSITLTEDTVTLPAGLEIDTTVTFTIILPEDIPSGVYTINIIGTDGNGFKNILTIEVTVGGFIAFLVDAFGRLFSLRGALAIFFGVLVGIGAFSLGLKSFKTLGFILSLVIGVGVIFVALALL